MNNKKYTQITFQVKRTTGVISFLMLNGGKIGLLYNKKFEREEGNNSNVVIYYTGSTELNDKEIKKSFLTHPGVIRIEDISIVDRADMRTKPRPEVVAA